MNPVILTGWEHGVDPITAGGGLASLVAGSPTVSASIKRTGSYALRLYTSSTPTEVIYSLNNPTGVNGVVYLRYEAWPSVDNEVVFANPIAGVVAAIKLRATTHKLFARFWGTADGVEHATTLSLNTWYKLAFKFDFSANPTTIDFQVDGVAATQASLAQAATTTNALYLGGSNTGSVDLYLDDLVVSTTPADYPMPDLQVVGLRPHADSVHNAGTVLKNQSGTVIDGSTAPAWSLLDDSPMNALTDYVQQDGIGGSNYVTVQFEDTASSTIYGVSGVAAYHASSATANSASILALDGNSGLSMPVYSGSTAGTSLSYARAILTPTYLTASEVNSTLGRVGYATNVASIPYFDGFMLEVAQAAPTTTYTLTADTGAFSLSGVAATLLGPLQLTAETGVFVLTGIPAGLVGIGGSSMGLLLALHTSNALTSTNRLIAEPGVFTLTGNAADLIATYRLSAEPGVFTLTGKPTLFFWSGMSAYNPRRALVIQPENRTLVILREDRTYVVTA